MAPKPRSRRARIAALRTQLHAQGQDMADIAECIARDEHVTPRAAWRLACGLSQQQVADRYNTLFPPGSDAALITAKQVSYWETWPHSGRQPSVIALTRLARIYGCTTSALITDHENPSSADIMARAGCSSSPAAPSAELFAPAAVGMVSRALYPHGPLQLDAAPDLRSLRQQVIEVWELRQSAQYLAMAEWLSDLLREAGAAAGQTRTEQEQGQATAIMVHACNAASSLLKRLNAFELAAVAADRAYQAACSAGDELLQAAAALRVANVFLAGGRCAGAIETAAGTADVLMGRADPPAALTATCGALLLTAALAAARLNESAQAWQLLGAARAASLRLAYDHADLHAVFGPANVLIHGVQVATELGDPREALRRAGNIRIDHLPESLAERRSTLLVDIARSRIQVADYVAAVGALLDAERIAPEELRFNALARQLVTDLLHRAPTRMPELRTLASSMAVQA